MNVDSHTVVQGGHVKGALLLVVMNSTSCAPASLTSVGVVVVRFGMELVELSGRSYTGYLT
jgi:hypothetical protein